jgi:hypothetical protein
MDLQLGTIQSSVRFKEAIKPMDKASEALLDLQPVTFRYKHELDPDGVPQFGLVAEQVAKVNPDLVAHDAEGKVYSVRYEAVNAMLLNEFLKEHRSVQDLKETVAQQQKQIEALTATVRKVSDQKLPLANLRHSWSPILKALLEKFANEFLSRIGSDNFVDGFLHGSRIPLG